MKTVYYAVGGGLGHLARARRVLRELDIEGLIVTSCDGGDVRVTESDDMAVVIGSPDRLIVDTFPFGIRHELKLTAPRVDYVARRLKLREYALDCGGLPPLFHTTYVVEELEPEHEEWIRGNSANVLPLHLPPEGRRDPSTALRAGAGTTRGGATRGGTTRREWLIVHSGPAEEVYELIAYTQELMLRRNEQRRVLVATRADVSLPDGFERVQNADYESAERIISAAGFNVMLETEPWRGKHHIIPFPRRFDDQFARAARRKRPPCL